MNVTERLNEIEGRANGASRAPWIEVACLTVDGRRYNAVTTEHDEDVCEVPMTPQGSEDSYFIAAARTDVPALVAALRAVLALHRPLPPERGGLVSWTYCSCGTTSVTTRIDGAPSIAPVAHEDCPTVRAITTALDVTP